jgi:hypothetical protein
VAWNWSADTDSKTLALLTAKVRDIMQAILSPQYAERAVREMKACDEQCPPRHYAAPARHARRVHRHLSHE